jgi:electron transport complex protein RnfA
MEFLGTIAIMAISAIFINNLILTKFLGLCPYLGVSKKLDSAFGMGMAVIFVMTVSSAFTSIIDTYLLQRYDIQYLQTIAFILAIAVLVQFVEMIIQKTAPMLYKSLGVYLPLMSTNCAIFGVTIINTTENYSFITSTLHGLFAGLGFTLVLLLMAGIRERLEKAEVPDTMQGMPIALVIAGCMALAFLGFSGLKLGG